METYKTNYPPFRQPIKGFWEFSFKDNGIGIDVSTMIEYLSFFSVCITEAKTKVPGALALQKIAELHGGKIWMQSEPGKESDFKFTLAE